MGVTVGEARIKTIVNLEYAIRTLNMHYIISFQTPHQVFLRFFIQFFDVLLYVQNSLRYARCTVVWVWVCRYEAKIKTKVLL